MKKFITPKRIIAVCIIVIALILEYYCALYYHSKSNTMLFPEVLYYTTQIGSCIFVTSGVLIAVWQYYLASKSEKTNLEIIQVQRAIDLAEYYKDNILRFFPAIHYIFTKTEISKLLDAIYTKELRDFDSHELNTLLSPKTIARLKEVQETDEFLQAVLEANDIYNLNFKIRAREVTLENDDGSKEVELHINKASISMSFIVDLMSRTLNNMEYFALHFKHQTADESVIYQSLHQSYIEMMPYFYYFIANQNTDTSNKYYTNVIWLYQYWKEKKQQQDAERSAKTNSIVSHGTIIKK